MGIIERLLKPTPFYSSYKKRQQNQIARAQQKTEEALMPLRVEFYREFIKPSDLVFDVGANVGNRVKAFLQCGAKVIAVEPQPVCVRILEESFGDKITIENVGLSSAEGELEMIVSTDNTVSSFSKEFINKTQERFKYSKWDKAIKVPVTTLDKLIDKYGTPAFCKIDVEGFELEVLKGLHKKIPFLSIEYCVPEMQSSLIACIEQLHVVAPNATFNYSIGETMTWAMNEWQSSTLFVEHVSSANFVQTSFGDIYIKSN